MIFCGDSGTPRHANRAVDVSESQLLAQSLNQTLFSWFKLSTMLITGSAWPLS